MHDKCTWYECNELALYTELNMDGDIWSCLCEKHHETIEYILKNVKDRQQLLDAITLASYNMVIKGIFGSDIKNV